MQNKPINLAIGIPSPDTVKPAFAIDNLPMLLMNAKKALPEGSRVDYHYQSGVRTDRNRNIILKHFLELEKAEDFEYDYILWLDADMIYPMDIVEKMLSVEDFDILGTLYFKKSAPNHPVAYVEGETEGKYKPVDPRMIKDGHIYEVAGLGFGGMMVKMEIHRKLVQEGKWMRYSENFHEPGDRGQITHDLIFCEDAKELGYTIKLHGGISAGHIGDHVATEHDWYKSNEQYLKMQPRLVDRGIKVKVILPWTKKEQTAQCVELLNKRSGYPFEIHLINNSDVNDRMGFIESVNMAVYKDEDDFDYYVYVAQDAVPGRKWLLLALEAATQKNAGVLAFNSGRWQGTLAQFGMISNKFIQDFGFEWQPDDDEDREYYRKVPFCPAYSTHYADVELTVTAMQARKYVYAPDAVLMEVDFEKESKKVNQEDKELYKMRRDRGFDGRVQESFLLNMFEPREGKAIARGTYVKPEQAESSEPSQKDGADKER